MLVTRGLERVLADLTAMGYDSRWGVISAADVGANHKRERIWIRSEKRNISDTQSTRQQTRIVSTQQFQRQPLEKQFRGSYIGTSKWWASEPSVGRVDDGVAARVDRLKAIGNGQVPLCAATAWELLR